MTVTSTILLFTFDSLLRLEFLALMIGVLLIIGASLVIVYQRRNYVSLRSNLAQYRNLKVHSVEYDLVLKTMKLAVWRVDVATRIVTFESDYRENSDNMFFPPDTTVDDVYAFIDSDEAAYVKKGMEDLMAGRVDDFHTQYKVVIPHSDRFYWSEGYATVDRRDLQNKPLSIVGTSMRIDQQKNIEYALMDAVYHAEESDRLKSAFLQNISHEIRTPLNAIVGFSNVLTMVDEEEERKKLIGLIKQNNTHLLRLFDDIVSMSKLEAKGGGTLKRSTFQLASLFQDMAEKYESKSKETGVAIRIADAATLPTLSTDRDRLREILNQYMNNAMKFTAKGEVALGCDNRGDKWRIWVRDTGKGIPADKCNDQLFERFVKVDEFVPGTGLGLSICRSLAMTLNGEVGVESTYGEGSVFWVELNK